MKKLLKLIALAAIVISSGLSTAARATVDDYYEYSYVYSNAYDGFTNIRQSTTTKSAIVGIFPNGSNAARYYSWVSDNPNWYYIEFGNVSGYVAKSQIGWSPTASVNLDIKGTWLQGTWEDTQGNILTLDTKGNFMIKGDVPHTGKWRLTGGNDITLKGNYGGWIATYTVNLYEESIGDFVRYGSVPSTIRAAAVNTSNMNDRELTSAMHRSVDGNIPAEYAWMLGEWHATDGSQCLAVVTNRGIRAYNAMDGGVVPEKIEMLQKAGYAIMYKHHNGLNKYFVAISPSDDSVPTVYVDRQNQKLFYISGNAAIELTRTGEAEDGMELNIPLIATIAILVIIVIVIAIIVATRKRKEA